MLGEKLRGEIGIDNWKDGCKYRDILTEGQIGWMTECVSQEAQVTRKCG